jgi:starch phosphorylase
VAATRSAGYRPSDYYERLPELRAAIDSILAGIFSNGDSNQFRPLMDGLLGHDEFLLLADYPQYIAAQEQVDQAYRDVDGWTRKSILNAARCGYFSSDRAVQQYNEEIWKAAKVHWL